MRPELERPIDPRELRTRGELPRFTELRRLGRDTELLELVERPGERGRPTPRRFEEPGAVFAVLLDRVARFEEPRWTRLPREGLTRELRPLERGRLTDDLERGVERTLRPLERDCGAERTLRELDRERGAERTLRELDRERGAERTLRPLERDTERPLPRLAERPRPASTSSAAPRPTTNVASTKQTSRDRRSAPGAPAKKGRFRRQAACIKRGIRPPVRLVFYTVIYSTQAHVPCRGNPTQREPYSCSETRPAPQHSKIPILPLSNCHIKTYGRSPRWILPACDSAQRSRVGAAQPGRTQHRVPDAPWSPNVFPALQPN